MLEQGASNGTEFVRNDIRRKTSLPSFDVLTNYARDSDWPVDAGVAWGGSWMPPRVGEWQLHPVLPVDERCARLPLACRREEAAVSAKRPRRRPHDVRRLSDRFGWPINIVSEPGVGTTVTIEFPTSRFR
jgi:hypothetical protein